MEDTLRGALLVLLPSLVEAFGVVLMAILTWAAWKIKQKTGLDIEEKHREALHKALVTGVTASATKALHGAPLSTIAAEAVDYARQSVPDAIKALKPSAGVLLDLAMSKAEMKLPTGEPATGPVTERPRV